MVSRGDRVSVLYPEYFDSNLTRDQGRRVPKNIAVPAPTIEELEAAAKGLELSPVLESDIAYSKRWWRKNGRVLVHKKYPKGKLLKFIGKRISMARGDRPPSAAPVRKARRDEEDDD